MERTWDFIDDFVVGLTIPHGVNFADGSINDRGLNSNPSVANVGESTRQDDYEQEPTKRVLE